MDFHLQYLKAFLNRPPSPDPQVVIGDATPYDVQLSSIAVAPSQHYWRVAGVHHLVPVENQSRHVILIDAVDEAGLRVRDPNLRVMWGWEGQHADEPSEPKRLDKGEDEPAGNVDLFTHQHTWIQIAGDGLASERVVNLHGDHPDEPDPDGNKWNTFGHHSFYVVFQRTVKQSETPDGDPGSPGGKVTPPQPQPKPQPKPQPQPAPQPPAPHPVAASAAKLGFYIQVANNDNGLWDAISQVRPPVMLFHTDATNDILLNEIRATRAPDTFTVGRFFKELGAQRAILEDNDPEGQGRSFAEMILNFDFQKFRKRGANGRLWIDAWMSVNEAIPGPASGSFVENQAEFERLYDHYDRFQVALHDRLHAEGIEAVAFNFAAGNFIEPEHYLKYFPRTLETYTYLGFHEYGWPSLQPGPGVATGATIYRKVMEGIRAHYGARHQVVITEAGLTRAYGHAQNPDEGWLNQAEPLSEAEYWSSLNWYNTQLAQDDYVLGACLYQVGHGGDWGTFRHIGADNQGATLHLIERMAALRQQVPVPAGVPEPAAVSAAAGHMRADKPAVRPAKPSGTKNGHTLHAGVKYMGMAPSAAAASAPVNEATAYAVRVVTADVAAGQTYWRLVSVRHLTPEENQGKHNAFVDAVDENGQRVHEAALRIGWTWEGRRPDETADPIPLDKPDNEPAGNVDIFKGMHLSVWLTGDGLPSDQVENMHTEHPDEPGPAGELWNSIGHHSFYIRFQRTCKDDDHAQFKFEAWPVEGRAITQNFGARPEYYAAFGLPGHEGIDFAAAAGSRVCAVAPGMVSMALTQDDGGPYGIQVRIEHAGGYRTIYAHLQQALVDPGQTVTAGQAIGLAGMTGNADGPHLHLTLERDGATEGGYPHGIIDPTPFLRDLPGVGWNDARLVKNLIADNSVFKPGQSFSQTWTLLNNGTLAWGEGYRLLRIDGDPLTTTDSVPLPPTSAGATAEITVQFQSPDTEGSYRSTWQICDANGVVFGDPVWAAILVGTHSIFLPIVAAAAADVSLAQPVRIADKLGIDANAPIDAHSGRISDLLSDPSLIAASGVSTVRLNFILGEPWQRPTDQAQPLGLTWQGTYRQILDKLHQNNLRVYVLIGSEAVGDPGDRFRDAPGPDATNDEWVRRYVENLTAIARMFRDDIGWIETYNEPDDWHGQQRNWVHPSWMAVIQDAVYQALHSDPALAQLPVISAPLQGLQGPNVGNGAPDYLDRMYQYGIVVLGWGQNGKPFPFDGVGYHLYIHEEVTDDEAAQTANLFNTMRDYLGQMRAVIRNREGREKPLYISECGWHSNGNNQEVCERFQAMSMRAGLNVLAKNPGIAQVIYFCAQDFGQPQGDKYYGLYRPGPLGAASRKPAFDALRGVAAQTQLVPAIAGAGGEPAGEGAADFAPPPDQVLIAAVDAGPLALKMVKVWNSYGGLLLQEAQRLAIDPDVAVAVLLVESGGDGFGPDGRMTIRFENHIFYHYWGRSHPDDFAAHFEFDPDVTWQGHRWRSDANSDWQACHQSQDIEWQVFSFARSLDETAAMLSISMGMAQVMGFNFDAVGYDSVQAMFAAYSSGADGQIKGFFRYNESRSLIDAIRSGDFRTFATGYNGPGQADAYSERVRQYLAVFRSLRGQPAVAAAAVAAPVTVAEAGATPADVVRFLVRLGSIYECALASLPESGAEQAWGDLMADVKGQLEKLLE